MVDRKSIVLRREFSDREDNEILDKAFINLVFDTIFDPGVVRNSLKDGLSAERHNFRSIDALIVSMRNFFATNIPRMLSEVAFGELDKHILSQLHNLAIFEKEYRKDLRRFDPVDKPDPNAIFWPNPTYKKNPRQLSETLPFIKKLKILDSTTRVGSAGSCFASEIALYFQNQKYNFVVEEWSDEDGASPRASARWGIIFNTPSFRQLAEKAFGLREMPLLAEFNDANGRWQDPFRENVIFSSIEELDENRDKHLVACQNVFKKCEVFVLTLGLNECWEFIPDGTVASRFPKSRLHSALFRHKVLSVSENVKNLQSFLDIIRVHNPEIQLIVSISPIPCLATGRANESHVITANEHSKATLRVAAEEFINNNSGVYYFPGYEMVNRCIAEPWDNDGRHVTADAVEKIMKLFEIMFVK